MIQLKSKPSFMMNETIVPQTLNSFFNNLLYDSPISNSLFDFTPKTDIIEKATHYEIKMALPGLSKEDIKINLDGDNLIISGEKSTENLKENEKMISREIHAGKFQRIFKIGKIDKTAIDAKFEQGILSLELPKLKEELPLPISIK